MNSLTLAGQVDNLLTKLNENTKLGDIRKLAKDIKTNHFLAIKLWETGKYLPRLLAILIMDNKMLSKGVVDKFYQDFDNHSYDEKLNLNDWMMANQLLKNNDLIKLIETWQDDQSSLKRRTYWYYQARIRWTGKNIFADNHQLLSIIEQNIQNEEPEVQWAMNLTAGWIGVYDEKNRNQAITIGQKSGLYKDEKVSKGCTPNYLPEFIRIELEKRKK